MAGLRTLAVCCAGWSAVATGRPGHVPVAVVHANRVVSVSPAARADGVAVGLRRREAQARCPVLELFDVDPARDARAFEGVLGALDDIAPRWEVTDPGRCAVPSLGPSRYHGGDRRLAAEVAAVVEAAIEEVCEELRRGESGGGRSTAAGCTADTGAPAVGVAIADGPRAATLLAEDAAPRGETCVVPAGATADRLAAVPVAGIAAGGPGWGGATELEELVDVLRRLGLRNLGRFAAIEPTDVLARFGTAGALAHDFARGEEKTRVVLADLPADLRVSAVVDPPAEVVDRAAFVAKVLADELHGELSGRGLACTKVLVAAETEVGDRIERLWRHEGALSAAAVAQRARWQLDGWLSTGRGLGRCRGGISRIELVPDQVVPDEGRQLGFWGGASEVGERALRGLARVQAMLGHDAVVVPEWRGGRAPGERYRPVPLETVDLDARVGRDDHPWPGSLPAPSPAVIWPTPVAAVLLDAHDHRVGVDGRGMISSPPAACSVDGGRRMAVQAWAGPWCIDERWWDPVAHRRRARIQVFLGNPDDPGAETPAAHLLTLESGRWWVEATYD